MIIFPFMVAATYFLKAFLLVTFTRLFLFFRNKYMLVFMFLLI